MILKLNEQIFLKMILKSNYVIYRDLKEMLRNQLVDSCKDNILSSDEWEISKLVENQKFNDLNLLITFFIEDEVVQSKLYTQFTQLFNTILKLNITKKEYNQNIQVFITCHLFLEVLLSKINLSSNNQTR